MKINKLNYETFVIDYLEGQLSADQRQAFERFVEDHPEVRAEMDHYLQAPIMTEDERVVYSQKAKSKKRGSVLYWVLGGVLVLMLGTGVWMYSSTSAAAPEVPVLRPMQQEDTRVLPLANEDKIVKSLESEMPQEVVQENWPIESRKTDAKTAGVPLQIAATGDPESEKKDNQKPAAQTDVIDQLNQPLYASDTDQAEAVAAAALLVAENPITKTLQVESKMMSRAQLPAIQALAGVSTPVGLNEPRIVELVTTIMPRNKTTVKKKSGWRKLITPQSYEDIDLRSALVSQTLKSAVEDTENAFVPEILLTK